MPTKRWPPSTELQGVASQKTISVIGSVTFCSINIAVATVVCRFLVLNLPFVRPGKLVEVCS
jgi:hypothetical protein